MRKLFLALLFAASSGIGWALQFTPQGFSALPFHSKQSAANSDSSTTKSTLTTLYNFCSEGGDLCTDGNNADAPLTQGPDGNLYGITSGGGAHGGGTVFKVTLTGTLTTLYSFCSLPKCADGDPGGLGNLVLATDGNFYGTTIGGGKNTREVNKTNYSGGTVFRITPSGNLKTLYSFCTQPNCTDGQYPWSLVLGTDGNFYGTTEIGGATGTSAGTFGGGTVFKISPTGSFQTLYSFCSQPNCTDGTARTNSSRPATAISTEQQVVADMGVQGLYSEWTRRAYSPRFTVSACP